MKLGLMNIYRQVRRHCLWHFRKKYVLESMSKRKGKCKVCGCCEEIECKYSDGETSKCIIYDIRPLFCRLYPIDEKDKSEYGKIHCGFYWEE